MATNKLFEAAADILAQSKKNAPTDPMHKADGAVNDLGGPTPETSRPTDDSNKLKVNATDGFVSRNQASIQMKPSGASGDMANRTLPRQFGEDIDALFADDSTISEDFKQKATVIYEARVNDRVNQIQEQLEEQYGQALVEAVDEIQKELTEKVDDYLNYVVEQWMEENQLAIESGLRTEITEEFISGLRNLFAEHYVDVPAEKVDLVEELVTRVEELETKLNEEMERSIDFKKDLVESRKVDVVRTVSEGLTVTQFEKIKQLAESVEFTTEDEYKKKLMTIRENYFPSGVKQATNEQLNETDETDANKPVITDAFVAAVSNAISKTKIY